jgi:hypothetical protein
MCSEIGTIVLARRVAAVRVPELPQLGRSPASVGAETSLQALSCASRAERTMDRDTVRQHLEWSAAQVAEAQRFVAKHRMLVATLEREGRDTAEAKKLLAELELCLKMHIAEWSKLRNELSE